MACDGDQQQKLFHREQSETHQHPLGNIFDKEIQSSIFNIFSFCVLLVKMAER